MELQRPFFDQVVGKRIGGRYLVDRMLGQGGMGLVVVAKYPELGQKVAIKFLRPELAAESLVAARFMREARVAAKVKSAHFVRVFDVGKLEGVPYLVMELLTGRDLGDELAARGPLPIAEAIDCILQAGAGVAEIHALGIVHRDLKPSNLFLAKAAGTPVLKVLDFGISKEKGTESEVPLTGTDHVLGTPQYMSPEQVKASKDVDMRSDIWSLGVILYELLTQSLPFSSEGGGVGEMFGKILYVDPEKPSSKRTDLPAELEAVILKCMARDRAKRFASVLELAEALRPWMAEGTSHRLETIKQASEVPPVEVDDEPLLEVGAVAEGLAPTALSDRAIPNAVISAPTDLSDARMPVTPPNLNAKAEQVAAPVTAMTSSSAVISSKPVKPGGSRAIVAVITLAVLAIGGGVGIMMARSGATDTPTTGMVSSTPSASATTPVAAALSPAASESAAAFEAIVLPSPTPPPSAKTHVAAHPVARPTGAAGAAVTAAPKGSAPPSLILDRK